MGIPVEELAVLIRKVKSGLSSSISGIGDINDLITDLNNAGGNIFDALKKDPGVTARAYDFGETISKADTQIEAAFEREESARNLIANTETGIILVKLLAEVLMNDPGFQGKLFRWLRKTFKP